MILQIHDELIFEVPDEEIEEVKQLVHETMVGVMPLKIPLVVDIILAKIGKNVKIKESGRNRRSVLWQILGLSYL